MSSTYDLFSFCSFCSFFPFCSFFCIRLYIQYVGFKFKNDSDKQCQADSVWLIGLGFTYFALPTVGLIAVLFLRSPNNSCCVAGGYISAAVSGLVMLFSMIWSIYW